MTKTTVKVTKKEDYKRLQFFNYLRFQKLFGSLLYLFIISTLVIIQSVYIIGLGPSPITVYGFVSGDIDQVKVDTDIKRTSISLDDKVNGVHPFLVTLTVEDSSSIQEFSLLFYDGVDIVHKQQITAHPWETIDLNITLASGIHNSSEDLNHSQPKKEGVVDNIISSVSSSSSLNRPDSLENEQEIRKIISDIESKNISELIALYPLQTINISYPKQEIQRSIEHPSQVKINADHIIVFLSLALCALSLIMIRYVYINRLKE